MIITNTVVPDGSITLAKLATDRYTILTGHTNFTAPYTGRYLIYAVGGGGGGGSGRGITSGSNYSGEGGQAGNCGQKVYSYHDLNAGQVYPVAVGSGGGGGAAVAGDIGGSGASGGDTLFNNVLLAYGGIGGARAAAVFYTAPYGTNGMTAPGGGNSQGGVGGSSGGNGANAVATPANDGAGGSGGGGGGNGASALTTGGNGADGNPGYMLIMW